MECVCERNTLSVWGCHPHICPSAAPLAWHELAVPQALSRQSWMSPSRQDGPTLEQGLVPALAPAGSGSSVLGRCQGAADSGASLYSQQTTRNAQGAAEAGGCQKALP